MPELSRFFGVIIRMFVELKAPHHIPHFHAYYQDEVAIYSIDPIGLSYISLNYRPIGNDCRWAKGPCRLSH